MRNEEIGQAGATLTAREAKTTLTEKDPKIDWPAYDRRRKAEGADYDAKMKGPADNARAAMGMAPGARDWRVSAILLSKLKAEHELSYWDLVAHLIKCPKDPERRELDRPYCHIMAPAPDIGDIYGSAARDHNAVIGHWRGRRPDSRLFRVRRSQIR